MRASLLLGCLTLSMVASAFLLFFIPKGALAAVTTTTVVGWLVPDGTHWNNGVGAVLYPLVGVGLFAGIGRLLDLEGDFGVTLILMGLTIGGALSMLSINASNTNILPFALVVVPGVDLVLWMWRGGG